ncbi:MAG: DUF2141 domain-containing protein [Myxococcales bacterium]|nr:DUF2141 domain-containing protein [Myxococcales bacterium]
MNVRFRFAAAPLAFALASIVSTPGRASGAADGGSPGLLSVQLTGLRSPKGKVGCTLYAGPRGFPTDPTAAAQQRWCPILGGAASCPFAPSPPGTYAVACFHDENDNGKLDTGLFGIPTEGTAISNDARGTFGPPSFDAAKFTLPARPVTLALRVRY